MAAKGAKKKAARPKRRTPAKAAATLRTAKGTPKQRMAAMRSVANTLLDDDRYVDTVLKVASDESEAAEVRLAALNALRAASFQVTAFEKVRGDYIAALRRIALDPAPRLRELALDMLSCERDGFAQKHLLAGLRKPDEALVPPEVALQFLANDVHSDAYATAREILENPPNERAKGEALRLLAADPTASTLFEKVLRDKNEQSEHRLVSAAALQSLEPASLLRHARAIVEDASDYDEIQATCLTALTNFGSDDEPMGEALVARVRDIRSKAKAKVRKSAGEFLKKYGE